MRGIFLNSPSHLGIIADIGANADFASAAIQKCDYDALLAAIRNSWTLNQRLDAGTNPPEVQQILDRVATISARPNCSAPAAAATCSCSARTKPPRRASSRS